MESFGRVVKPAVLGLVLVGLAVGLTAGGIFAYTAFGGSKAANPKSSFSAETELEAAAKQRGMVGYVNLSIGDSGRSMTIDNAHSFGERSAAYENVLCVLTFIKVPDAVVSKIEDTRALDGRQEAEWGDFRASWTYHPDDGLNTIIEEVEG